MPRYRRANAAGASYFFTLVSYRRQTIVCNEPIRAALRHAIKQVQDLRPFIIDAWVLLPDHLHCIWTLPEGDSDFAGRWGMNKRKVSLACAKHYKREDWITPSKQKHRESTIWQRRYWGHQIRDDINFMRHVDYRAPLKMRLLSLCGVGMLLEMLMYYRVHSAFSQHSAWPKAKIHYF